MKHILEILFVIIAGAFAIWLIGKFLTVVADERILKYRAVYFRANKSICEKCLKMGRAMIKSYPQYCEYATSLGLNKTINCSVSVVAGSGRDPIRYLLKYSHIGDSVEDMDKLEVIERFLDDYTVFKTKIDEATEKILEKLPWFERSFADEKMLAYTVCGLQYEIANIKAPFLRFLYVSPAGRAVHSNKITVDANLIKATISEVSRILERKGHSRRQRSIMTNDLREAIKKRDNYTCRECGNSVYKEPNLLLEVDHIIPISRGGKTEADNLQTLCWRCNRKKSNK